MDSPQKQWPLPVLIATILAGISAVAAVIVVPEVRDALGLPGEPTGATVTPTVGPVVGSGASASTSPSGKPEPARSASPTSVEPMVNHADPTYPGGPIVVTITGFKRSYRLETYVIADDGDKGSERKRSFAEGEPDENGNYEIEIVGALAKSIGDELPGRRGYIAAKLRNRDGDVLQYAVSSQIYFPS
ncbi:hypothetical protein [Streptosporangium saharense]|uniref:hypothetical protein n=1 Tax=Streptosporangium saharense TaxID=1706840 RepID=UPI003318433D